MQRVKGKLLFKRSNVEISTRQGQNQYVCVVTDLQTPMKPYERNIVPNSMVSRVENEFHRNIQRLWLRTNIAERKES